MGQAKQRSIAGRFEVNWALEALIVAFVQLIPKLIELLRLPFAMLLCNLFFKKGGSAHLLDRWNSNHCRNFC
ncbi:hypothetical protein DFP92_105104 [Yoonia sediminilitoris]|uniref:Uncharacterized protein n=1 Tax=Yoonia sediminilitoris TaxID=1286148 RepID=A0A2T6KHF4_9RHOB|nr:hypothetical protein C8N45_105104 [Yoonia sediminilitoris]RCW95598.1 hypothetical protein DFP92_105104 [Yoonia sediminilitoris]